MPTTALQAPSQHGNLSPSLQCYPLFLCAIWIESQIVELRVSRDNKESIVWHWSVRLLNETLLEGRAETRFAAQVEAQVALERRLQRAGLNRSSPATFEWKELLAEKD
jgi:hypothetical protein